jgi:hypothetical protein
VAYSTSNLGDTGYVYTYHVYLSTQGVGEGVAQVHVSTGLTGNTPYNFRVWTKDPMGYWSPISNAANTTVTSVLSVSLSPATYDFGEVDIAATTLSISPVTVHNEGNIAQTYTLSIATVTSIEVNWVVKETTPTANDMFVLGGKFNSVQPSTTAFTSSDVITSTPMASTATRYAGNQTGLSVDVGSDRSLWMMLFMPLGLSTTDQQSIDVTVTAGTP